MPKRRSVVPGYTKRLQRTMRRFNVPKSVVAPDMHAKPGEPGHKEYQAETNAIVEAGAKQISDGSLIVCESSPVSATDMLALRPRRG